MPTLTLTQGHQTKMQWRIFKAINSIGSDVNADICLQDAKVPLVWATITRSQNLYIINSMAAKNPVIVGGKPVQKHSLADGDQISLGSYLFRFSLQDAIATNPEVTAYRRLLDFSRRLAEESEMASLLDALVDEVIALTSAEKGFLVLLREDGKTLTVTRRMREQSSASLTDELSDSILKKVLENKKPVVISDALHDQEFSSSKSVINFRLSSVMCVPLMHRARLLGAIYVANNSAINVFDQQSLEVLTVFAGQASLLVQNALAIDALKEETKSLKETLEFAKFGEIIGTCNSMQEVFKTVERVAKTNVNVLVTGETGTGKELIARELHRRSERAEGPLVVINCGAIPPDLLESELFGHVKGAFTGAYQSRIGKFQAAHEGTLFLDEIGDMPPHLQVKILRALQENQICRLGENKMEPIDIRVIAATNRDLFSMVKGGTFREDLYYRLNVIQITVPPLKERGNDVLVIANYFLHRYAKMVHKQTTGFTEQAQNALLNFSWPGNVRQLENRIKRAIVMSDESRIKPVDLDLSENQLDAILPLSTALEKFRKHYVHDALERNAGNRTKAAKELGVDPRTIFRHLEDQKKSESIDV